MVLLIIIPMKNGYFIGNINPTFSDKPKLSPLLKKLHRPNDLGSWAVRLGTLETTLVSRSTWSSGWDDLNWFPHFLTTPLMWVFIGTYTSAKNWENDDRMLAPVVTTASVPARGYFRGEQLGSLWWLVCRATCVRSPEWVELVDLGGSREGKVEAGGDLLWWLKLRLESGIHELRSVFYGWSYVMFSDQIILQSDPFPLTTNMHRETIVQWWNYLFWIIFGVSCGGSDNGCGVNID